MELEKRHKLLVRTYPHTNYVLCIRKYICIIGVGVNSHSDLHFHLRQDFGGLIRRSFSEGGHCRSLSHVLIKYEGKHK